MPNNKSILVVEDETNIRKLICSFLAENNFKTIEAEDGKEASVIYKKNEIDCIISDIFMPNMNGIEFAKFNYENRLYPFIVCTTLSDANTALELLNYGVQDYILKPFDKALLISTVLSSIKRMELRGESNNITDSFDGNVGTITIQTKWSELHKVTDWLKSRIVKAISLMEAEKFLVFVVEFLVNSYEHGNLKIGEEKKTSLIESGLFEAELRNREKLCKGEIKIDLSVLKNEIAVKITDDGDGFQYGKYLDMDDEKLVERMEMPNGRGIFMAKNYFDSVNYQGKGNVVILNKKF